MKMLMASKVNFANLDFFYGEGWWGEREELKGQSGVEVLIEPLEKM